jgi:hypothetical protein
MGCSDLELELATVFDSDSLSFAMTEIDVGALAEELEGGIANLPVVNAEGMIVYLKVPAQQLLLSEDSRLFNFALGSCEEENLLVFLEGRSSQESKDEGCGILTVDQGQQLVSGMMVHPDRGWIFFEPLNSDTCFLDRYIVVRNNDADDACLGWHAFSLPQCIVDHILEASRDMPEWVRCQRCGWDYQACTFMRLAYEGMADSVELPGEGSGEDPLETSPPVPPPAPTDEGCCNICERCQCACDDEPAPLFPSLFEATGCSPN